MQFFVLFRIRFRVFHHAFDFFLAQTGRTLDGDVCRFARAFVFGGNVQDAVRVNVEGHFDLRHAARCGCDVGQVELPQRFVRAGFFALALQHVNRNRRLVVFRSGEHLRRFGRNGGVFLDEFGHHAAHGFDTQRQRGNVQQQYVAAAAAQYFALNRRTHGHGFVRVHVFARLFAEELFHGFLYFRHTGLATHQNHIVNIACGQTGIFQRDFARLDRTCNQVFHQAFEFGTGDFQHQVFRAGRIHRDIRQVDFGLLAAGQLDFGFFCGFFHALHCHRVVFQINALFFFELVDDVVDDTLVEVFAAQEGVAVGGQHFKLFVAVHIGNFDDGNIERTAAQVVHRDFAVAFAAFVHAERQSGCGRFVDDAFHVQTGNAACVFGGLALAVVEVGRHGHHGFGHFLAQIGFCGFFHFTQHFGGNLRWGQFFALRFHPSVAIACFDDFKRHGFDVALHFFVFEFVAD